MKKIAILISKSKLKKHFNDIGITEYSIGPIFNIKSAFCITFFNDIDYNFFRLTTDLIYSEFNVSD